jgi:nitrous oxidase accessory protein NosD
VSTGILTALAVVGNTVSGTGSTGVALGASAYGSLVGNRLIANGGSGILCNWTSYGPVIDNVMIANKEYGFIRMEESRCRESGSLYEGNLLGASEIWRPQ